MWARPAHFSLPCRRFYATRLPHITFQPVFSGQQLRPSHLRARSGAPQPSGVPERWGRPAGAASAGRRYSRGPTEPRHLLPKTGQTLSTCNGARLFPFCCFYPSPFRNTSPFTRLVEASLINLFFYLWHHDLNTHVITSSVTFLNTKWYLSQDEVHEAYQLLRDLEPTVPQEYILKGVVNAAIGQESGSVSEADQSSH